MNQSVYYLLVLILFLCAGEGSNRRGRRHETSPLFLRQARLVVLVVQAVQPAPLLPRL